MSKGRCVRVGLVAHEPIRRAGLMSAFEGHAYIEIIRGEIAELLADLSLEYLILDLNHHRAWIKVLFTVRRKRKDIRQIILGPSRDEEMILQSIQEGARAFLDSSCGPLAVRQAVECVVDGTIWAPRRLMSVLIDRLLVANPAANVHHASISNKTRSQNSQNPRLSPREQEVLKLITLARSNREIAQILRIEERTVKAHVASLFRKTGVESRVSLLVNATQKSLQQIDQIECHSE